MPAPLTPAMIWCMVMITSLSLPPPPPFTLELHLLSSGLMQDYRLAEPPFSSQRGERRGGISRSSSLISHLTKASDEDNKHSASRSLSLLLSLIYLHALLCWTVRVLVEHGSSDTFHIVLCCVCSHMRLCAPLHPFVYCCELETAYIYACASLAFSAVIILRFVAMGTSVISFRVNTLWWKHIDIMADIAPCAQLSSFHFWLIVSN